MSTVRLAADIGGTFTDLALEVDGQLYTFKLLTTHHAPEQAVLQGAETVLAQARLQRGDVGLFVHGTTLATNALIERRGAPTALLTTGGFRDTLELGTESRFDQYDLSIRKPAPLVPRNWRFTVPERMAADGSVLLHLDRDAVRLAAQAMVADGIRSVAVCFLHSYANPVHEQAAAAILAEAAPELLVSLSSEISPEMREWERFSTTAANAYVQPVMASYLRRLRDALAEQGYRCPLFLMLSSGDLTTVDLAIHFPVRLVESGPRRGGAIFAAGLARSRGLDRVLSFDMGGTTAKLCLVDGGAPVLSRVFEVARSHRDRKGSGLPLRIPVVEMVEIGAGGGSIARRDAMGRIRVGPDSAGSDPGPACYGRGGTQPTVSDADLLLGRLSPAGLAGGSLQLDRARAAQAMAVIGQDEVAAAYGVGEIVDEAMAAAARQHAAEQGASTEGRVMIAFGGAAPLHAARLAEKLGVDAVLIPRHAGVGSAIGFLQAPIAFSVSRSLPQRLARFQAEPVNAVLAAMAASSHAAVALAAPAASRSEIRHCFARYVGQAHEIAVPLPLHPLLPGDATELRAAFDRAYAEQYGQIIPGMDIEVMTWSVRVTAAAETPTAPPPHHAAEASGVGTREVFDPGTARLHRFAVVARDTLRAGDRTAGPALMTENETTTVVPPGWTAAMEADGGLMLRRDRP